MSQSVSLLPQHSTRLERAIEAAGAALLDHYSPIDLWNLDEVPTKYLPFVAEAFSVDQWDPDWTEDRKRAVIRAAINVHRLKGTPAALDQALAALNRTITISEWFEHGGTPYTFRAKVNFNGEPITAAETELITRTINAAKNVRSRLEALDVTSDQESITYLGVAIAGRVSMSFDVVDAA